MLSSGEKKKYFENENKVIFCKRERERERERD